MRGRVLITAMAAGAAAAAAHSATTRPMPPRPRRCWPPTHRPQRRGDDDLGTRHADDHRQAGRQYRGAQRGARQRSRLRPGARPTRGPASAATVRHADQGHFHVELRIPLGVLHAGIDIANSIGTRSWRCPTVWSSMPARPPVTGCGSSCATPTEPSRSTVTSTARWSASASG
ncbi:m23B family peptidase [Mycobacterium xenopi 4042]|uniref:M23B family peptidase n=1 Tax=Mycobacterium xenopi 4042 TaxID=1299334 RepID=X8AGT6_MYCXE|nr:m23B family peptidase [Mycobacterium xenopi 4042]